MALKDIIAGPPSQHHKQIRALADAIEAGLLGAGGTGAIDVSAFATGGDGTEADPWTGWDTAITWTSGVTYVFPSGSDGLHGHYAYATSPNYLKTNISLIGYGNVFLHHTGTGDAFVLDSPDPGVTWIHRLRVENFTILGNVFVGTGTAVADADDDQVVGTGTAFLTQFAVGDSITFDSGSPNAESHLVTAIADNTHLTVDVDWKLGKSGTFRICKTHNGIFTRGMRNGIFKNVTVHDVARAALYSTFCVTNTFENFCHSYHDPIQGTEFLSRAQYGIELDTATTTWSFLNAIVEGTETYGVWIKDASYANTFLNGTSEGHKGIGVWCNSVGNEFINFDVEANAGDDIVVWGSRNVFENCLSDRRIWLNAGQNNVIRSCNTKDILISDGSGFNEVSLTLIGGTFTDEDNSTYKYGNLETLTSGLFRYDSQLGNVIDRMVAIDSATTIDTNARLANIFSVQLSHNTTLANPTNAKNGQLIGWRFTPSTSVTIAFGNKFRTPSTKDFPVMCPAGSVLYIFARYHSTDDKFDIIYSSNEVFATFEASDISAQDINATGAFYVDDMQVLTSQQAAIAAPTGGATVDTQARTAIGSILTAMETHGLIAVTAPFNLANTALWAEAQFLTYADSAKVKKWRERSGNGRHLAQSDPSRQPLFIESQINGKPCVRFNGSTTWLLTGAFSYSQAICVSLVMKRYNNAFKYIYSSIDSATGISLFQGDGASSDEIAMYAGSGSGDPKGAIDSGSWYLATMEYNGSSSKIYENGVQVGSTGNPGSGNGNGLILGARFSDPLPAQIDVAALVIYLTSERSNVETYLLDQYSL
jgi:hypothetical protein